jgi:hypothetical protein
MAIAPSASAAARRDLVQRIERFLDTVDKEARTLDAWETDLIGRVVTELEAGNFRMGDDVMLQVERPDLYRSPKAVAAVGSGLTLTANDVRSIVAKVLKGEPSGPEPRV